MQLVLLTIMGSWREGKGGKEGEGIGGGGAAEGEESARQAEREKGQGPGHGEIGSPWWRRLSGKLPLVGRYFQV